LKLGQVGNLARDTVELCSRSCKPHLYVPWTCGVLKKKMGFERSRFKTTYISTSLAKRCAGKEKS
jgi:hypothetical protein